MRTPASTLLRLMWLASPALPVGGFSYSEGLEAAVEAGLVQGEALTADWLCDQMALGPARAEWPAAAAAFDAWSAHDLDAAAAVNAWVLQTRESAEFRLQTEQMGRSLAEWLRLGDRDPPDARVAALAHLAPAPTWPVAYALGAVRAGASRDEALLALAFSWCESMAQAAIKAVPLGQAGAQRVLARLVDEVPAAVDRAMQLPADERQAFTPMLAILSGQHETQYSRLFRS